MLPKALPRKVPRKEEAWTRLPLHKISSLLLYDTPARARITRAAAPSLCASARGEISAQRNALLTTQHPSKKSAKKAQDDEAVPPLLTSSVRMIEGLTQDYVRSRLPCSRGEAKRAASIEQWHSQTDPEENSTFNGCPSCHCSYQGSRLSFQLDEVLDRTDEHLIFHTDRHRSLYCVNLLSMDVITVLLG